MSKISNVILMLQYLENGRKYNIKELSEKLEVSERMIRVYKEDNDRHKLLLKILDILEDRNQTEFQ